MTIKPMETEAEIDGKAFVHWKAWQEAYADLLPQKFLQKRTLEQCQKRARLYPQDTLVALVDGQVVGFSCYGSSQEEEVGELYALYVLADYYGQGIGYQLMQATLEKLQSYQTIFLWVLEGNTRAIAFYEKVGFRFDGVTKTVQLGEEKLEYRMVFKR